MGEMIEEKAVFASGSVWLAGAGPGNPDLLTLLAARAINEADVILYDALVGKPILQLAPKEKWEYAGKRRGDDKSVQQRINQRMIALAGQNKKVLRLKGGDPCMFARGGEEAEALAAAKVPFRIIPGITAGIAAMQQAGMTPTHRDYNHAVSFITGHAVDSAAPLLDWQGLAKGSPVLVLYMARHHLDSIARHLLAAGRKEDEPVAIIANATLPEQSVQYLTLGEAAQGKASPPDEADSPAPPTIITIGAKRCW